LERYKATPWGELAFTTAVDNQASPMRIMAALSVLARRAEKLEAVASAAHLALLTASPYFADSPLGVLSDALAALDGEGKP
jgi:hypothetical protein